jgi:hypothetical protein
MNDHFDYKFEHIRSDPDELLIALDYNDKPDSPHPIMLFRPADDDEHYHIELTRQEAIILRDWLDRYLGDKPAAIAVEIRETVLAEDRHSSAAVYNAEAVEVCLAQDR